jgi:hypothetical protein
MMIAAAAAAVAVAGRGVVQVIGELCSACRIIGLLRSRRRLVRVVLVGW